MVICRVYRLSKKYNFKYTRYADDLAFSGDYIPHSFIELITSIVIDFGLNVNNSKTKLIIGDKQKIVTGISVQGKELKIPRKTKRLIKQEIHFMRKFSVLSHISKLKIKEPNYILSIEGKLRFWLQIEPDNLFAKEGLEFILNHKLVG
ncbi:hypothetical protein [Psychromonas arctica]|uniref:hypothetical protein n=1 Tax=Psychromonas arctica TaxID=168275 RepID=UPI00048C61E9|nr:hypothetical protein [Psychromonas arctica]